MVKNKRVKIVLGWAGLAFACVLTFGATSAAVYASTGPTTPGSTGTLITSNTELRNEYTAAAKDNPYSLPAGVKYPASASVSLDPHSFAEPGVGESHAAFVWKCAWEGSYFNALDTGDSKAAASALTQLAHWTDLAFVKKHVDDPEGIWQKEFLGAAQNGDSTVLRDEYTSSCQN